MILTKFQSLIMSFYSIFSFELIKLHLPISFYILLRVVLTYLSCANEVWVGQKCRSSVRPSVRPSDL